MFNRDSSCPRNLHSLPGALLAGLLAVLFVAGCAEESEEPPCAGSGTICTFMGTGKAGLGQDGRPAGEVHLYLPQDLAFGPDARPYVLDWNNHRVRTLDADDLVRTVVGTGQLGDAPDGKALDASLNHPTHVTFDPSGMLILSAWHNSKVARVDLGTGDIKTFCGNGARAYGGDGGPAEDAVLDLPVATVFDSQGRLYIMDQANQRVRRIEADGTIDTVVGPSSDWTAAGYVKVCQVDPDLQQTVCKNCLEEEKDDPDCEDQPAGRPQGFSGDGGPATDAFLYLPFSQSAPPAGRMDMGPGDVLYITDTGNQRVRAVGPDGIIRTVAGSGPAEFDSSFRGGYSGDGGPATEAMLSRPTDVAADTDGGFYIADTDNSCVRYVDPSGIISTAAGVCGKKGFEGDRGAPDQALLNRPYGVALDDAGNLYIADTHNHRIRVVYK